MNRRAAHVLCAWGVLCVVSIAVRSVIAQLPSTRPMPSTYRAAVDDFWPVDRDGRTVRDDAPVGTLPPRATWYVEQVRKDETPFGDDAECYAKLGDTIWIDCVALDEWLADPALQRQLNTTSPSIRDIIPVLNGVWLTGVHPEYVAWDEPSPRTNHKKVAHLRFRLTRNEASRDAWSKLLNQPVLYRPIGVSVGFPNADEMYTNVVRGAPRAGHRFYLVVIPRMWLVTGLGVVLASLALFWWLAASSDLLRDTTLPRRPDGRYPFSLGRVQMAFWFFLVISSYFFLWVVTGDKDTVTSSVLTLIGISAGTALGAAIVDAGKATSGGGGRAPADLVPAHPATPAEARRALEDAIAAAVEKLKALEQELGALPEGDAGRAALQSRVREQQEWIARLRRSLEFFGWPRWKVVMYDLLGDAYSISFHRFQIFIWTIVLGIIFCTEVYKYLSMPEFSGTLLGLMGISAGTYIGFKLPETRQGSS